MTAFALVAAMVLTACSDSDETAPEPEPSGQSKSPTKDELTLGVWGNTFEVAAFEDTVKRYNDASKGVHITVESWPDRESMNQALAAGERSGAPRGVQDGERRVPVRRAAHEGLGEVAAERVTHEHGAVEVEMVDEHLDVRVLCQRAGDRHGDVPGGVACRDADADVGTAHQGALRKIRLATTSS